MEKGRERRKSEGERSEAGRTLFVRNLPYSTTDDQLASVFAEYGAVKTCFTVKDKGITDKCKGYGYVLYEKRDDAKRAKSGVRKVKGRLVQIVFADKRPVREERRGKCGEKAEEKAAIIAAETDLIDDVVESESEDSEEGGSDYDEDLMTDGETNASSSVSRQNKPKSERREARFDAGRVVVVTEVPPRLPKGKLRKKCSKYGPLEEFVYPVATAEGDSVEGVNGSKAHVTYVNYADARKAVAGLKRLKLSESDNPLVAALMTREGKTVSKATLAKSRLIVRNISFTVTPKDLCNVFGRYGDVRAVHIPRKPNGYMRGFAFVQFASYFEAARAVEGVNGVEVKGRPVAVDWVVPKTTYEVSLQSLGTRKEEEEDMEAGSEEGEEENDPSKKPFRPDVHKGTTIFVRNLPLDSSEEELKDLFTQFGRVRYARIVLDKTTGLSRGSAFVQFLSPASVQQCMESVESNETVLLYHGRELEVSLALSPQELDKMKESGTEKTDRRNLFLAKEGNVQSGSEAAKNLTTAELAKRLKAQAEKKAKLSNPNFYVSRTRLSVRNLPTQTTESELREIFNTAIDSGRVVQLKILRSKDRVDANGIGRSKGFAFVEFSTHETALTALRATNNNPSLFANRKRLIVEFAVEDVRVMRVREDRKKRQGERAVGGHTGGQNSVAGGQGNEGGEGEKRKSKKVEWQLRCKEKRLRRRETKQQKVDEDNRTISNPRNDGDGRSNRLKPVTKSTGGRLNRQKGGKVANGTVEGVNGESGALAVVGVQNSVEPLVRKRSRGVAELTDKTHAVAAGGGKRVKLSKKQSRNARKRGRETREEERFAEMVDSYRKKLAVL
ncbi:RNA-binding protein 28 [Geodia barretti]|uniref:RNA-binding protein 28 n=1 Tax=Geodia barretti TaxID=519541 RepID=A0AA35SM44_GEOBA|nr:RNA-binding protein 28 [Geodia barretti]